MGSYNCSIQEDGINSTTAAVAVEPKTSPMTIFYAGLVLVFDDYSADKAKEVVLLASKGSSGFIGSHVESSSMPSASNIPSSLLDETWQKKHNQLVQIFQLQEEHHFAGSWKKKRAQVHSHSHRASARAPYQLHNPSSASTKEQFDLNL